MASFLHHLIVTCNIAAALLHAVLFWPCARSQRSGFISIDCGSNASSTYVDEYGIQWTSDRNLIKDGKMVPVSGHDNRLLSTMRLFDNHNRSKYCYSLTSKARAFFMVRATFWAGKDPHYTPKNDDGNFRFKMIVDADEWMDLQLPYDSDAEPQTFDVYVRAQRRSIDVCLARIGPDGDAPFISTLELRPLPATLTSTTFMRATNTILIARSHYDYGDPATRSLTRYPYDPLDRIWTTYLPPASLVISTDEAINTENDRNELPQ